MRRLKIEDLEICDGEERRSLTAEDISLLVDLSNAARLPSSS